MGILRWCGELIHDMFCVPDNHPMTEKEYDRWNSGQMIAEFPGRMCRRIREERQHRELIEAIQKGRL